MTAVMAVEKGTGMKASLDVVVLKWIAASDPKNYGLVFQSVTGRRRAVKSLIVMTMG
ncbi:MAG: hypothetical protein ACYDH5_04965 [Acidimicrobiales bacterium]